MIQNNFPDCIVHSFNREQELQIEVISNQERFVGSAIDKIEYQEDVLVEKQLQIQYSQEYIADLQFDVQLIQLFQNQQQRIKEAYIHIPDPIEDIETHVKWKNFLDFKLKTGQPMETNYFQMDTNMDLRQSLQQEINLIITKNNAEAQKQNLTQQDKQRIRAKRAVEIHQKIIEIQVEEKKRFQMELTRFDDSTCNEYKYLSPVQRQKMKKEFIKKRKEDLDVQLRIFFRELEQIELQERQRAEQEQRVKDQLDKRILTDQRRNMFSRQYWRENQDQPIGDGDYDNSLFPQIEPKGPFRRLQDSNGQIILPVDLLLSIHKITQPISFGKSNRFPDLKDPYYKSNGGPLNQTAQSPTNYTSVSPNSNNSPVAFGTSSPKNLIPNGDNQFSRECSPNFPLLCGQNGHDSSINSKTLNYTKNQKGWSFGYGEKTTVPYWELQKAKEIPGVGTYSLGYTVLYDPRRRSSSIFNSKENLKLVNSSIESEADEVQGAKKGNENSTHNNSISKKQCSTQISPNNTFLSQTNSIRPSSLSNTYQTQTDSSKDYQPDNTRYQTTTLNTLNDTTTYEGFYNDLSNISISQLIRQQKKKKVRKSPKKERTGMFDETTDDSEIELRQYINTLHVQRQKNMEDFRQQNQQNATSYTKNSYSNTSTPDKLIKAQETSINFRNRASQFQ